MDTQELGQRPDLHAAQSTEVLQPTQLPAAYGWMRKGFFAVYNGIFTFGQEEPKPHKWGWQVDHVKGETREGAKSCLGFTRYHSDVGHLFNELLSWATVFPSFFRIPNARTMHASGYTASRHVVIGSMETQQERLEDDIATTEIGTFECFKVARPPSGYTALNKWMWYDKRTSVLVKIEARTLAGQLWFGSSLCETLEPLLSSRRSADIDKTALPSADSEKEYGRRENLPWWKKLPSKRLGN